MLIITGPGRSGTSVLALFCQKLGYDPGGEWCDAVDAGLENRRVVAINDALLREIRETGGTHQTLLTHGEEMRQIAVAVVKDPRFTFHPDVLRAWRSVRDDISVLLTYRTPEHCLASRQRQARFLRDRRSLTPDTIRCQVADSIETLLALEIPFQLLLFPKFLGQFDQVYGGLETLGLDLERPQAEHVWTEVVDSNKVHIGRPAPAASRWEHGKHPAGRWIGGVKQWQKALPGFLKPW